jgi:hypothetical protein
VREFAALNKSGAAVGITWRLMRGTSVVAVQQPQVRLGVDGWVTFRLTYPLRKGTSYTLTADANDANGLTLRRVLTLTGI